MSKPQPENISESPAYWTHKVDAYPGPVAVTRMAQLIDFDDRLYEAARIVYRFLINYYHKDHGDALLSMRHVSKVMRARTPQSTAVLSHSAVRRGIIALMETGWVVRTVKGRGKGRTASRYVPVLNVLDLAGQGKFPELLHAIETVDGETELLHANETVPSKLLHVNEAVGGELLHAIETKTLLLDPRTLDPQGTSKVNVSAEPASAGLTAAAPSAGFEKIWAAYGKLGNKTAAKEAFVAIINPDVDHIAERAAAWKASARPGQKRMPLEKWLAAEKYDEADRRVERPARKARAVNDNTPKGSKAEGKPAAPKKTKAADFSFPMRRVLTIVSANVEHGILDLTVMDESGEEDSILVVFESSDMRQQAQGERELHRILDAVGVSQDTEDASELEGKSFVRLLRTAFGDWEYEPVEGHDTDDEDDDLDEAA